jgi:hypothetical protein
MCDRIHFDTKHRIIALFNIVFIVYRFITTAGRIKGLEPFIKNKFIKVYNKDDNLCIFACLAYELCSERYLKTKNDVRCIHRFALELAKQFYNGDENVNNFSYKGFDTITETKRLCEFFKVNITYYTFENNKYK